MIAIPLASQQQPRLESVRVLVVEDDPDMRALLYDSLLLQGMSGDVAADGLEGLKLALERSFDVVVSDIRLPGIGGIDLARRISHLKSAPKVILVTAFASEQVLKDAQAAGACRVLAKPIGLKVLAQNIYEVVGRNPSSGH